MNRRLRLNGPLAWSAISMGVCALAILLLIPSIFGAAFGAGTGDGDLSDEFTKLMSEHEGQMKKYEARFNGRSIFFKPTPPAPPPIVRPEPEPEPEEPPKPEEPPAPTPPPSKYGGPDLHGMLGDTVFFANEIVIKKGEEKDGIKVLEVHAPWSVKVAWEKGEYDVSLFDHYEWPKEGDFEGAATPGIAAAEPAPGDETATEPAVANGRRSGARVRGPRPRGEPAGGGGEEPVVTGEGEGEEPAPETGGGGETPEEDEPTVEPTDDGEPVDEGEEGGGEGEGEEPVEEPTGGEGEGEGGVPE